MKRAKNTSAPQQRTELDRLAVELRAALRRETTNIIEIGNLLIESRKLFADEHGEWLPWLEKNFDRSERSAHRYIAAAEYVAAKSATVADFSNLSPSVLHCLARNAYNEQEEAAILAATRKGRVDTARVEEIRDALAPPPSSGAGDTDNGGGGGADEDAEIEAILDGPPPGVSPAAPSTTPDLALRDFDQAISALKRLRTKSTARFAGSIHAGDLEDVESFIRAVADRAREVPRERTS